MNRASVFFLGWSLFSVVVGIGCREPEPVSQRSTDETESHVVTLTVAQQQAIGLVTAPTVAREVEPIMESFGRVIPRVQGRVQVTAPVAGRVTTQSAERIPVPGTVVHRGQLLAEVEQTYTAPEQVQLDVGGEAAVGAAREAKAALDAAAAEYQRSQNLFVAKIVSRKRVEEAQATWLQAQSRYETALRQEKSYRAATATGRKSPRRFPLTAPIDGVIVQADITAGQQVDTATPLFLITDASTVWVEAPIFEGDLEKIDSKSLATIYAVGEEQRAWTGRPLYTSTVVDPLKRTASLVYEVDNADGQLKLGMSVTVRIPAGPPTQKVMAPEAALIEGEQGKGVVYVRQNSTLFAEKEVKIGDRRDGFVAVEGDLTAGEDLVVTGAPELFGMMPGRLVTEE